jgi:UDP-N-acetylmuramate: L-alanyl-gamma-D-glutamyl-meso-diaminopimelate ligase
MAEPKTVHLLGVCGCGMSALACLLKDRGYEVTGSDENPYPPATTLLEEKGVRILSGYSARNLDHSPDLVVVGNVIRRDNPEARAVEARGYNALHMARALSDLILPGRTPIVVAGTHGKTSTSSLIAWILHEAGLDPGYFIGGVPLNFGRNNRLGGGQLFVLEGDEYDCAYFDKVPKFIYYRPRVGVVGNIEFEHADIYPTMATVRNAFSQFISLLPPDGFLAAGVDDHEVRNLLPLAECNVEGFGRSGTPAWNIRETVSGPAGLRVVLEDRSGVRRAFSTGLWGEHHALNLAAAVAVSRSVGVTWDAIKSATASFRGVKRRLEPIGEPNGVTVIDDYAHHPTEVAATIRATRARYPERRLWVVLEPRTQTARRRYFQKGFSDALVLADRVVLAPAFGADELPAEERLDVEELVREVSTRGVSAQLLPDAASIAAELARESRAGDVVLVMSPGSFGGLHRMVLDALKAQQAS